MPRDDDFIELLPGAGIRYRRRGGTAEMLLARHAEGNTLSSVAFAAISAVLKRVDEDHHVHGLVIRSSTRTFCSGGDYTDPGAPGVPSPWYVENIAECYQLWRDRRVPVIAVVNGPARAFGCAIALSSDLIIAYRDAYFQLPEMGHGIVPSFAIAALRTRHHARFIRQLVMSCTPLRADRAHALGVISDVVDDSDEADRLIESYIDIWRAAGPDVTRQAMRTIAEMEMSPEDITLEIARAGVEEQLDRFREQQADQTYLDVDRMTPDVDHTHQDT